ncbi:hypothetical protein NC652_032815 [Populus alba x Populus x berolinensis]|uniref:Ribosomal protein L32 n=1 Tax=Populus alba x Populus x berolinensis TaxID=444605 RepID=A0AAD6LS80_9ROSI|nr:hypothetical protein NC652_032815 [Populus alba x Populus x berolinensis]KAJ6972258.1 hypothetical protein NC653_032740 [Populus alba x Populus x berolinensis]
MVFMVKALILFLTVIQKESTNRNFRNYVFHSVVHK